MSSKMINNKPANRDQGCESIEFVPKLVHGFRQDKINPYPINLQSVFFVSAKSPVFTLLALSSI